MFDKVQESLKRSKDERQKKRLEKPLFSTFIHTITGTDLWFTTLGGKYP